MASLGGTPFGARRAPISAGSGSGVMPATWKMPYDLFEERRRTSSLGVGDGSSANSSSALATSAPTAARKAELDATPSSAAAAAQIAETVNVRGIKIAGWVIETHRGSIADSKSIDDLSDKLGIPLPEMPFDKNRLVIRYEGSTEKSGNWEYIFDGQSALQSIEGVQESSYMRGMDFRGELKSTQGEPSTATTTTTTTTTTTRTKPSGAFGQKPTKKSKRVQVSYANEWGKKREQATIPFQQNAEASTTQSGSASSNAHEGSDISMSAANGVISAPRDYDWTYSCTWPGRMAASTPSDFTPAIDSTRDRIPIERLGPPSTPGAKAEPIFFFDDVILYEDELGDNGSSMLSVKVRVMPTGFLVLQRFFLRVDNVVFRLFDTRMYVSFYAEDEGVKEEAQPQHLQQLSNTTHPFAQSPSTRSGPPTTDFSRLSLGTPRSPSLASTNLSRPTRLASPMRVIRECCGYQERYSAVRARLPPYKPNDLAPLTDPGWVSQQITFMAEDRKRKQQRDGVHSGTTVSLQQSDPSRPAVLPSATFPGQESNRILGEVKDSEDKAGGLEEQWEGEGHRVDVALVT